ncbi:nitrilotriacetate monooxygenase, partial [Enterobacter mori]
NLEHSPQGQPLLIQAGSSPTGTDLAARVADVVFTAQTNAEEAKVFNDGLRSKLVKQGRSESDLTIMPGLFPVIGDTEA